MIAPHFDIESSQKPANHRWLVPETHTGALRPKEGKCFVFQVHGLLGENSKCILQLVTA